MDTAQQAHPPQVPRVLQDTLITIEIQKSFPGTRALQTHVGPVLERLFLTKRALNLATIPSAILARQQLFLPLAEKNTWSLGEEHNTVQ